MKTSVYRKKINYQAILDFKDSEYMTYNDLYNKYKITPATFYSLRRTGYIHSERIYKKLKVMKIKGLFNI